ncbi:MAG: 3'-5' exonuclease [Lachnospiraceae bacterium]|nr:3'-5' exonuclease [Lachnospiraceae bacterium]
MENILEGLNEEQLAAVTATEGVVRVIAGAGSGKTRALSHRFAYLVNELGILPGNILCVTFTNKSANEMRQRIHMLTGDNDTGYINTFHGFCVSILQEDSHAVSYPKNFLVLDNSDIDDMLKIIYEERGLTLRNRTFGQARDMIEMQKLVMKPEYYLDMITMPLDVLQKKYQDAVSPDEIIFYGYLYQEKKCFGLDYNDLIKFSLYIFEQNEDIKLKWQERLEYIMIDEFQDIDALQYRLMEVLAGYHHNLFIVGDPDQTIYTWRGANVRYLLDFDHHYPQCRTIMMMKNYRSTPEILDTANSLISKNKIRMKKDLIPVRPEGERTICHFADTAADESAWIAGEIEKLHEEQGIPYRDMTVLYRAHYVTRNIEEALLKKKIPYTIYSGVQFFGRAEIKDALAYLRMVVYRDDLSFRRIVNQPKRNIGIRRMEFLEKYAAEREISLFQALTETYGDNIFKGTGAESFLKLINEFILSYEGRSVTEVLSRLVDQSGYETMLRTEGSQERLDNLAELKQSAYEYETSCGEEVTAEHFLNHVALFTNADTAEAGDKVKLMTVHTAKGLEFPYVFLCAMNEGIFPSGKTRTEAAMEEERRLAYVAMTRAKKQLYLTEAGGRNFDGSPRYPSRFLLEIDPSYIWFLPRPSEELLKSAKRYVESSERSFRGREEAKQVRPGTKVRHPVFGEGEILRLDNDKSAYVIQFASIPTPRSIAYRAKLEILDMPGEEKS